MSSPVSQPLFFGCLCAALCAMPTPAFGQAAEDVATAKAAIVEARALRGKHDYAAALPKFQAAYALVPTPLTGVDLAKTMIQLGQFVQAEDVLTAVTRMPKNDREIDAHRQARIEAGKLVVPLRARIALLTLAPSGVPAGENPSISIDGRSVSSASLSVPRRMNPGHHTVEASLGAGSPRNIELDLKEGESRELKLDLTPENPEPTAATPAPASARDSAHPDTPPAISADTGGGNSRTTVALVLGGAGIVATGIGAYLNLNGKAKYNAAKSKCDASGCSPNDADTARHAATQGTVGMVLLGVGAATVITSVTLWLTAPSSTNAAARAQRKLEVSLTPGAVVLGGQF